MSFSVFSIHIHIYDYIYLIFFKNNGYSMNTLKYQVGPPLHVYSVRECFGFSPHSAFAAILSRSCGRPSSSTSSQHNHIHRAPHLPPPRAPALLRWARVSPDLRGTPPWSSGKTLARLRQLPSYPAATHRCRHRPRTYLAHTYLA